MADDQLVAKINFDTYQKILFLRDLKPFEVSMLGQTLPDNPLHVIDVHLIKQEVTSVATDMDPEDITRHTVEMIEAGVAPVNSERFWIHTHPMEGDNSANPSAKDMNTWNDADNNEKNFQVMFILSKSGHMTCKARVRSKINVTGLPFDMLSKEFDCKIEIVETEESKASALSILTETFGESTLKRVPIETLRKFMKREELYPEVLALEEKYKELVKEKTYSYIPQNNAHHQGSYYGNGANNYNRIGYGVSFNKKKPKEKDIPEFMFDYDPTASNLDNFTNADLQKIADKWDTSIPEIRELHKQFASKQNRTSWENFLIGAINHGHTFRNGKIEILNAQEFSKKQFVCKSSLLWTEVVSFAKTFNGD